MLSCPYHHRSPLVGAAILVTLGLAGPAALAQGRVIIEPPAPPRPRPGPGQTELIPKALAIRTEITDGVAVTKVRQSFSNPLRRQVEGVYIFPLPEGVAVGEFSMTVGGKTLHGEVLDAETARRTYEDIVRRLRDPGLLEYLNGRLFRARIFPIPPNATVEVELQYSQTLSEQGGLGLFRHPLRTDSAQARSLDQLIVSVHLNGTLPLTTVFSPSHDCQVSRPNDREATVSYEAAHVAPDRDFLLYYQRRDTAFGLALLTHRGAGEPGTFLLRLSPRVDLSADQILPKDIAFVVDTSGSMAGEKLAQAQRALKFCINSLDPRDRFNIYGFSTEVHPFREQLVPASPEVRQAAIDHVGQMKALGGTNIHQALLVALDDDPRDEGRLYLIVFMTDGQPTVGVTEPARILGDAAAKNGRQVRFHVLGVGSEVNTQLLDKLAEATRGSRDYCTENEDLEIKLSAFVARLAHPVLTGLRLHIEGVQATDVYPQDLPDLFRGNDLVIMGRYGGHGPASIRVEGNVLGRPQTIGYEAVFPELDTGNDFLPRLWAHRKVAYLLDQIRLHGSNPELIEEVVRLAKRHGIVTPYTSALILEEGMRVGGSDGRWRELAGGGRGEQSVVARAGGGFALPASGAPAVAFSRDLAVDQLADTLDELERKAPTDDQGRRLIRHVGDRFFVLIDQRWADTAWDGQQEPTRVTAFSDEYFQLLRRHPELKPYFALGERVLVVLGGQVYETLPSNDIPG